jgi:hypothetical protein
MRAVVGAGLREAVSIEAGLREAVLKGEISFVEGRLPLAALRRARG